jgi:hypothetical protein
MTGSADVVGGQAQAWTFRIERMQPQPPKELPR